MTSIEKLLKGNFNQLSRNKFILTCAAGHLSLLFSSAEATAAMCECAPRCRSLKLSTGKSFATNSTSNFSWNCCIIFLLILSQSSSVSFSFPPTVFPLFSPIVSFVSSFQITSTVRSHSLVNDVVTVSPSPPNVIMEVGFPR